MISEIRGLRYRGAVAASVVSMLAPGDPIQLARDLDNKYDSNAVMMLALGTFIGYVQADLAVTVAEYLDEGAELRAHVVDRTDRNGIPYVEVTLPFTPPPT